MTSTTHTIHKKLISLIIAFAMIAVSVISGEVSALAVDSELAAFASTSYGLTSSYAEITIGAQAQLSMVTDKNVTSVKFLNPQGGVVSEIKSGAVASGGKLIWKLTVTPSATGTQLYTAYIGNKYGYSAFGTVLIKVNPSTVAVPVISNFKVVNGTVSCNVSGCVSLDEAVLVIRKSSDNTVVYADYKREKIPAGSYNLTAYKRSDASKTVSSAVSFTITAAQAAETKLLTDAIYVIIGNEGGYGSVNANDNGALSIGKFQWHGANAHDLLNAVKAENPTLTQSMLQGTTIYAELSNAKTTWSSRIATAAEKTAISNLLLTTEGKLVQDRFAEEYVASYFSSGRNRGINNSGCLLYYADLYNQGPKYAIQILDAMKADSKAYNLENIHVYALANPTMGYYASRRKQTYNVIKSLGYTA